MLTLEDIRKHAESDLKFDDTELDKEALRIPQIHNKYLNFLSDAKLLKKKCEQDLNTLRRVKWEYYTGKITPEELKARNWEPFQLKILRTDLDVYLNSDVDLQKMEAKLAYFAETVDYIESILKGVMNRHWIIRSSIDWRKFTNGVS